MFKTLLQMSALFNKLMFMSPTMQHFSFTIYILYRISCMYWLKTSGLLLSERLSITPITVFL